MNLCFFSRAKYTTPAHTQAHACQRSHRAHPHTLTQCRTKFAFAQRLADVEVIERPPCAIRNTPVVGLRGVARTHHQSCELPCKLRQVG